MGSQTHVGGNHCWMGHW